jgi:hypothetical protein
MDWYDPLRPGMVCRITTGSLTAPATKYKKAGQATRFISTVKNN